MDLILYSSQFSLKSRYGDRVRNKFRDAWKLDALNTSTEDYNKVLSRANNIKGLTIIKLPTRLGGSGYYSEKFTTRHLPKWFSSELERAYPNLDKLEGKPVLVISESNTKDWGVTLAAHELGHATPSRFQKFTQGGNSLFRRRLEEYRADIQAYKHLKDIGLSKDNLKRSKKLLKLQALNTFVNMRKE